jgi:prefoldin subunit 5
MSEKDLKKDLIRLAHSKPELRKDILAIIKKASALEDLNETHKVLTSSKTKLEKIFKNLKTMQDDLTPIMRDLDLHKDSVPYVEDSYGLLEVSKTSIQSLRSNLNTLLISIDRALNNVEAEKALDRAPLKEK